MKINTKQELKTLDGQVIDATLGQAIGNILVTSEGMNRLKAYTLGLKFHNDKEVELDEADLESVKKEIEATKAYTPLITGQVLSIIK